MKPHWNVRHGMCSTRIYKLWAEMKARCEKPTHPAWKDYGGRGITVCQRWSNSFQEFHDDFGHLRPDGTTIDRIENDKGYEPGNVRWATYTEQGRNKRNNVRYTAFGESKTVAEWTEDSRCHVEGGTLKSRFYKGWDIERAITEPVVSPGSTSAKHPTEKNCSVCGNAFVPHITKRERQKTCSAACANELRSRSRRLFRELRSAA